MDNLVDAPLTPPDDSKPTAPQALQKFLDDNNIDLRLTPPLVRQVEGGGVMVEQPQVIANYKHTNSITN